VDAARIRAGVESWQRKREIAAGTRLIGPFKALVVK
jgi:hypothetical protein